MDQRPETGCLSSNPVETTVNRRQNLYFTSIKDQIYFHNGALTEVRFSPALERGLRERAHRGSRFLKFFPSGQRGNYFRRSDTEFRPAAMGFQYVPSGHALVGHASAAVLAWMGSRSGFDLKRWRGTITKCCAKTLSVAALTCISRATVFSSKTNTLDRRVSSGTAGRPRRRPDDRRPDCASIWDDVVRRAQLFAAVFPRPYAPKWLHETKVAAGIGIFSRRPQPGDSRPGRTR